MKASKAIALDPARAAMLVNIADRLQSLPHQERVRVVSTSIAALNAKPGDRAALDTLTCVTEWPHWSVALPSGMAKEAETALRRAMAGPHHTAHEGIATLLDHSKQLVAGGRPWCSRATG